MRHRCHYCGFLSATARRVLDSGSISTEEYWACRSGEACKKRLEAQGWQFVQIPPNPLRKARRKRVFNRRAA